MVSAEGYRGVGSVADRRARRCQHHRFSGALHGALLFRVAVAVLRYRSEAEDLVQKTFLRALKHQRKLPEIRETRVWLVRLGWNLALDRHRRIRPD